MKRNTFGKAVLATVSATAIAGLTLTACGSDNNSGSESTTAAAGSSGSAAAAADCGGKEALTGEGSTAQQNAVAVFNQVWGQKCPGKNLSYNPTGSGAGVTQFIANQVDFAGSDSPLAKDQVDPAAQRCGGNPAWNLPLVFGPVALGYNLPGVDKLV
ncbi:MAG: substrate-binding domain-containing protein, partial [Mycobacterium sp.]